MMYSSLHTQSGVAYSEFLAGCIAALPLVFAIPLLGKYTDIRHKSVEAARYIVWDAEVFSSNNKPIDRVRLEASDRFFGHRASPIVDVSVINARGVTEDPLWRDRVTNNLLRGFDDSSRLSLSKVSENVTGSASSIRFIADKAGLDTSNEIPVYTVSVPVIDRTVNKKTVASKIGFYGFFTKSEYQINKPDLDFVASAGLMTKDWYAGSQSKYNTRVKNLTLQNGLRFIVNPGTKTLGALPIFFPEAKYGDDPYLVPSVDILPSEYIDNE